MQNERQKRESRRQPKSGPGGPPCFYPQGYFALGAGVIAGFGSLILPSFAGWASLPRAAGSLPFLPSVLPLTSGEAVGLAVTTGVGVVTLLGVTVPLFVPVGVQAPKTAGETPRIFHNINDLFIVFLLYIGKTRDEMPPAAQTSTTGGTCRGFPQTNKD